MGLLCVLFVGLCGLVKDSVEKWMNTKPVEVSAETANSSTVLSEAKYSGHLESDKAQEASQVTNQTNTPSIETISSRIVSPRAKSSSQLALREIQKAPEVADHTTISQIERTETQTITPSSGPSSWEIGFDRNLRRSLLIGLPDELLLRIMQRLNIVDMYMLRQVSFTFWRIYQDEMFADFHCPIEKDKRQVFKQRILGFASPAQLGGRCPTSRDYADLSTAPSFCSAPSADIDTQNCIFLINKETSPPQHANVLDLKEWPEFALISRYRHLLFAGQS
ncbi:hypothetical protein CSIM01_09486 [Colletotrichum simmondsii]|uniref:F-box domain-containing protein n=1 Tax=Colletotrichum simmondsii TaxID=703756 RepID=A0A135S7J7_9PEZI|nr:hypothetical protein CSIM01_09486 [Colletotrichum simmondsii]